MPPSPLRTELCSAFIRSVALTPAYGFGFQMGKALEMRNQVCRRVRYPCSEEALIAHIHKVRRRENSGGCV